MTPANSRDSTLPPALSPQQSPVTTVTLTPSETSPPRQSPDLPLVKGYELLGKLGQGGMGVVYKARHLRLNRLVALKMIRSADAAEPEDLARFRSEAEAVARFQHPHIV